MNGSSASKSPHSRVSVITPVYNASPFLSRVIACVQQQTYGGYEHILVNDASTDDSWDILQKLAEGDDRIKIINLEVNQGVVHARNIAIYEAKGRYLAFLDADDLWLPNKLEVQMSFMQDTGAVLSFTDYRFMSEDGKRIGRLLRCPDKIGWVLHHMTRFIGCLTVMLDRKYCPDFLFEDVSQEDFVAWSRVIANNGKAMRCPHDLARYAVVDSSRSRNGLKMAKGVWRIYRDVENILLFPAIIYFSSYVLFAIVKRRFCHPFLNCDDVIDLKK